MVLVAVLVLVWRHCCRGAGQGRGGGRGEGRGGDLPPSYSKVDLFSIAVPVQVHCSTVQHYAVL